MTTTLEQVAKALTKVEIVAALKAANAAPFQPWRASGCGRAYVALSLSLPRKGRKAMLQMWADACKEAGLLWCPEIYGAGGARGIYVGYDNCDGRALGKAEAFAKVLQEHGILCYMEAVQD